MRQAYDFGTFSLDVAQRRLLCGSAAVHLPPKTFDVLTALVRRAGQLVTKRELLETVWPKVFVDDGILTVHIAAVRRALGDGKRPRYIETVVGSGYRFIASVTARDVEEAQDRGRSLRPQEAEDSVARGRALLLSGASLALPAAVSAFQNAITLDDSYTSAHAGLALARCGEAGLRVAPYVEAYGAAKTSALRALAMESDSVDALVALGVVLLMSEWDWSAAERSLRRALAIDASHAEAQLHFGVLLESRGMLDEGLHWKQRALAREPRSPLILLHIAMSYWHQRRYEDAIDWAHRALSVEPRQLLASEFLGIVYWKIGDIERLLSEQLRRAHALAWDQGNIQLMQQRGEALRDSFDVGGISGVHRFLFEHFAKGDGSRASLQRASLLASLGDSDAAFQHLDRALAARDPSMVDIAVSPLWDPLRADPRFAARLREIGL